VGPAGCAHVELPPLATTRGLTRPRRGMVGAQRHCSLLWPPWVPCPKGWVLGPPLAPTGGPYVVLPPLGAANGVHQAQVAVCGQQGAGCTEALLPLVATVGGLPQAAGIGESQWAPMGAPMSCYLCWVPPVVRPRPKWWCVYCGQRGGCGQACAVASCCHHGWPAQCSRCWGPPVVPRG